MSQRKEQAIYDAVHETVMELRIRLAKIPLSPKLDVEIAQAGHAAGMAAIAAYRKPLKRKAR
jgi:hypothetical protein